MGAFEQILQLRRGWLNARFYEARHFCPYLEPGDFLAHLSGGVGPLVEALARVWPGAAEEATLALFDLSLELFSQEILGPRSPYPALERAWRGLFPALAPVLVQEPRRVAASLCNALLRLSRHASARPDEWIALLAAAGPACPDPDVLLRCGQVAAWRSGMAEYRPGALELLPGLPVPAGLAVLGLDPAAFPGADLPALAAALRADPWLDPGAFLRGEAAPAAPRLVARCGGFRGFGGPFLTPPRVIAHTQDVFVVREGDSDWVLYADAFGQSFQRGEVYAGLLAVFNRLDQGGRLQFQGQAFSFPQLAAHSGAAAANRTLAVSRQASHFIYLVSLPE